MRDWRAFAEERLRLEGVPGARQAELTEEVAQQLQEACAEALRRGASAEDAAAAAESHVPDWAAFSRDLVAAERRREGALEQGKAPRSAAGRWLADLSLDVLYGARTLRKNRLFAAVALLTIAFGVGANTAIFSLVDAVLLEMLPVREPRQLRILEWTSRQSGFHRNLAGRSRTNAAGERVAKSISYPAYEYLRDHNTSFSDLVAFTQGSYRLNVAVRGQAELANGQLVSGNYFTALGVNAFLGRTLLPEDDRQAAPVALLGHGFWTRAFGGDPGVVGASVAINGTPVVLVGVLPRGMCGLDPSACADLLLPLAQQRVAAPDEGDSRGRADRWWLPVMGRLKPGVDEAQARAELELLLRQAIEASKPARAYDPPRVALLPGAQGLEYLRDEFRETLRLLTWAAGAVLLAACANIAGLMLVRATARRREIATRLALGAGRGRLIRQLVTESLLLALLGGALGVALARGGGDALAAALSTGDGALGVTAALNPRVLAFSLALCVLTGLLFGLAPALRATGLDLATALRASGAAARGSGFRIGKALITVQVALSLVMVVGSALFVRTLLNLRSERLGFRPEGLLLFQLNPTLNGYKGERLYAFHQGVVEALESVPGVVSASMSRYGLLSGGRTSDGIQLAGQPDISVRIHYVAPRFFETLSFPMLAGRDLAWSDRAGSPRVAVVNQALASRLWGERNPIGEQALMSGASLEVVGLASDTKFDTLRQAAPPTVYLPYRQNFASSMTFVVRTDGDPRRLVEAVRRTVAAIDPQVPPYAIRTQAEQIDLAMRRERVFAALLTGFALLTLGLAGLGVYGTLAYLAARRTPEIGVRVALGAGRGRIVRLILGESSAPVLLGIAIGLWSALAAGRLVSGMLFGLQPQDTASLAASAAILLACALAAGLVPAWRASRIAPVEALRCE